MIEYEFKGLNSIGRTTANTMLDKYKIHHGDQTTPTKIHKLT